MFLFDALVERLECHLAYSNPLKQSSKILALRSGVIVVVSLNLWTDLAVGYLIIISFAKEFVFVVVCMLTPRLA